MKLPTTILLLAFALASPTAAVDDGEMVLVDRIVAVVDEDPIFLSDLRRLVALGLVESVPNESDARRDRRVLDGLIEQRLRLHEVERHDFSPLPAAEIERQVERIRAGFADPAELERQLERLGLDEKGLALLVERQLKVLVYIEKRLGPRVFIRSEEVRAYYDEVLAAEMARRGQEPPPLAEVRERIRAILREEKLNTEIEKWTAELRVAAEVVDSLDRTDAELPPVVERID